MSKKLQIVMRSWMGMSFMMMLKLIKNEENTSQNYISGKIYDDKGKKQVREVENIREKDVRSEDIGHN